GDKFGKSFTCQINKPSAGTTPADNIYTFEGGKIADWELSNSVDGFLMLKATCDFEKETIGAGAGAYAKQTFTSIANNAPFSYRGASITFNGTGVKAKDISIKVSQGLDTERFFIANGGNKYEPLQSERPNIEVELKAEYESNALASTSAATLAASKIVPVVATWNAPSAETAGGTASLVITFSYLRVDDVTNALGANGLIEQTIKGVAMGQSPMTAALNTPEAS
ncbi:MAG: phage tail tube protein, partial [Chitinophagaceae bacterium]